MQLGFLGNEQAQKSAADVAQSDKGEVVGRNGDLLEPSHPEQKDGAD
jgi:hypothetical protein